MEKQIVIDRITETENLTDNLEDDDANWLIDWGISKASELIVPISDEEVAGGKLNAVMAVMRKLNQIVGSRTVKEPNALSDDVRVLAMMYANAFGAARPLDATALKRSGKAIAQQTPHEIMAYLLNLIAPDSNNSRK